MIRGMTRELLLSMRPRECIKSLFVFVPLILSRNLSNPDKVINALTGVILFYLISGGGYLLNDIIDIEADKRHPVKSKSLIPAGRLKKRDTIIISLLLISLFMGYGYYSCFYCKKRKNNDYADYNQITQIKNTEKTRG